MDSPIRWYVVGTVAEYIDFCDTSPAIAMHSSPVQYPRDLTDVRANAGDIFWRCPSYAEASDSFRLDMSNAWWRARERGEGRG